MCWSNWRQHSATHTASAGSTRRMADTQQSTTATARTCILLLKLLSTSDSKARTAEYLHWIPNPCSIGFELCSVLSAQPICSRARLEFAKRHWIRRQSFNFWIFLSITLYNDLKVSQYLVFTIASTGKSSSLKVMGVLCKYYRASKRTKELGNRTNCLDFSKYKSVDPLTYYVGYSILYVIG